MKSQFIVIIPARFESERFPGKPLALLEGKEMVLHVLDKALSVTPAAYVATDDERIANCVLRHGGQAILTGKQHKSGTERVAEAAGKIRLPDEKDTLIINLQGDEPFIPISLISQLARAFSDPSIELATLVHEMQKVEEINNPNRVKVVFDHQQKGMYFSRSVIPYKLNQNSQVKTYQHIGVYAYRYKILEQLVKLPPSALEEAESLEQLRWLENGYSITCLETDYDGFGIDTPEDLAKAEMALKKQN